MSSSCAIRNVATSLIAGHRHAVDARAAKPGARRPTPDPVSSTRSRSDLPRPADRARALVDPNLDALECLRNSTVVSGSPRSLSATAERRSASSESRKGKQNAVLNPSVDTPTTARPRRDRPWETHRRHTLRGGEPELLPQPLDPGAGVSGPHLNESSTSRRRVRRDLEDRLQTDALVPDRRPPVADVRASNSRRARTGLARRHR